MGRHVAKNLVAAGLAKECEVQVAYAIGVAEPVSIMVDFKGSGVIDEARAEQIVRDVFDLRPAAIIRYLDLKRPIYRATAAYGHFGRTDGVGFSWEATNRAEEIKAKAGI
jgi:S-adenosylmethionine synthetase